MLKDLESVALAVVSQCSLGALIFLITVSAAYFNIGRGSIREEPLFPLRDGL